MSATRRWVTGAALAALVILAAGWFLVVKPQKSKVSDLHEQTAAQNATNAQLLTKITALQAEAKNNAQEQRILEKFATQIPNSAAEPALIRTLTQTANGSGVDLTSITPGEPTTLSAASGATSQTLGAAPPPGGSLFSLPLALSVTGPYANLESFFHGIEQLPRAFLVNSFTLGPASGGTSSDANLGPNALTASIATSVFYSDAPVTIPPAASSTPPTTASTSATTGASSAPDTSSTSNPAAPAAGVARHAASETN